VFGLVVGFIARLLYPGRQPMGFIATMILGIVGSLLGGFISFLFGFRPEEAAFQGAGWIMSIIGALIVVWIGLFILSARTAVLPEFGDYRPRRISSAALRPAAPMTPPPGWLAAPHRYSPRMGVW
jgi:uncharacterized membrane protein YeaQ/YmgE (transglycosylase-associated protein family)